MSLSKAISEATSYKDKAQLVWDHYLSRQLPSAYVEGGNIIGTLEPNWIHSGYELIRKFLDNENSSGDQRSLSPDELKSINQIIESHALNDGVSVPAFPGQPKSPMRIIHDGWKAGTPSWIFMGRALTPESFVHLGAGWVAVQRTIPDEFYAQMDQQAAPATLWMAYNRDKQMGLTALTSNVIGPAISFDQLWDAVNAEYGPLYKLR